MLRVAVTLAAVLTAAVSVQAMMPAGKQAFVPMDAALVTTATPVTAATPPAPSDGLLQSVVTTCAGVYVPMAGLDTTSKYDQSLSTRSELDVAAASTRRAQIGPIEQAIRSIGDLAAMQSGQPQIDTLAHDCAVKALVKWADNGALLQMTSKDAALTRGRMMAEIGVTLVGLDRAGAVSDVDRAALSPWLSSIADDTMAFFSTGAGSVSRNNNHRYWAGLAVGAIGFLTSTQRYRDWSVDGIKIGTCQVDADGHLPLELARGAQARNYHLYAFRPLAATLSLFQLNGEPVADACMSGFRRLAATTLAGLSNPADFARITGVAQAKLPSETTYVTGLRLTSAYLTPYASNDILSASL
ncbi:MAG TPA: alginate lyase family protein [Devosiaceae bacterium]|jgi:hypothetical protein